LGIFDRGNKAEYQRLAATRERRRAAFSTGALQALQNHPDFSWGVLAAHTWRKGSLARVPASGRSA